TKLWIYAFTRRLDAGEVTLVYKLLREFVDEWKSHQHDVRGAFEIVHDQFVLIAAESDNGISGCSIDSSVAVFKALMTQHNLDALDRSFVFYRDGDVVRTTTRADFQALVDSGKVDSKTKVFNNTITTVGELHAGKWEVPLAQSWHAQAFSAT
ncbi:MAG: hypothetical protein WBP29_09165, partial [Candidatus Zixiibacteriota bacterium]